MWLLIYWYSRFWLNNYHVYAVKKTLVQIRLIFKNESPVIRFLRHCFSLLKLFGLILIGTGISTVFGYLLMMFSLILLVLIENESSRALSKKLKALEIKTNRTDFILNGGGTAEIPVLIKTAGKVVANKPVVSTITAFIGGVIGVNQGINSVIGVNPIRLVKEGSSFREVTHYVLTSKDPKVDLAHDTAQRAINSDLNSGTCQMYTLPRSLKESFVKHPDVIAQTNFELNKTNPGYSFMQINEKEGTVFLFGNSEAANRLDLITNKSGGIVGWFGL